MLSRRAWSSDPAATAALLYGLATSAGPSFDTGELERQATVQSKRLDDLVEANPEHVAMLRQLAAQGSRRELHFWHACQSPSHLAFQEEVISAFQRLPQAQLRVAFESQAPAAPWAQAGRLDAAQLPAHLAGVADAYLCGPRGFMQAQRERLLATGWPGDRIHQETFGSGSA